MTTVQAGSPYERQETMEITGFVVLSTSSDGSNTSDTVKRSLHTINHVETESLIYGRGDREACKRFMKSGAEDSNAVSMPGRKDERSVLLIESSSWSAFMRLSA